MARKSKLLAAIDSHRGRDYQAEKQKKLQKQAARRKAEKSAEDSEASKRPESQSRQTNVIPELPEESDGWESDESEEFERMLDTSRIDDSDSDSDSFVATEEPFPQLLTKTSTLKNSRAPEEPPDPTPNAPPSPLVSDTEHDAEEDDVPLSDLSSIASSEAEDLVPHQRLTINNLPALRSALSSISLPYSTLSFSDHQSVTAPSDNSIPDINDDIARESAFQSQSLHAAIKARDLLQAEGIPFSRPADYFAEMVKSDEHMGKIKQRLVDDASSKKASEDAKKLREAKKLGKSVQVAKEQERAKEKKQTLERIEAVKRKRKRNPEMGRENEDAQMFDVELEEAGNGDRWRSGGGPKSKAIIGGGARKDAAGFRDAKRQKKNEKFGFGGKKRFAKSGDAMSSGDMRGFSTGKMKGKMKDTRRVGGAPKGTTIAKKQRLGKSRRAKTR